MGYRCSFAYKYPPKNIGTNVRLPRSVYDHLVEISITQNSTGRLGRVTKFSTGSISVRTSDVILA